MLTQSFLMVLFAYVRVEKTLLLVVRVFKKGEASMPEVGYVKQNFMLGQFVCIGKLCSTIKINMQEENTRIGIGNLCFLAKNCVYSLA